MTELHPHALVTGGAVRIGRQIVLTLAQAGYDVTIHYNTSRQEALNLAREVEALGRRAYVVQANLSDAKQVETLIPSLQGLPLTALVNNASLFEHNEKDPDGKLHDAVNNAAPRLLSAAFTTQLPKGVEGAIVHILDSTVAHDKLTHYNESRAKLRDDLPALALKAAPRVRVNAVSPGQTLINKRQSQAHFDARAKETPMQRPASPQDVATAVLFLLQNRSITGEIIHIDNGLHLL